MNKNDLFLSNQQLREARLRRGWSQQYLADQVGTTVVTVKRWEHGSQTPSPHFRFKLSALFRKEIDHLANEMAAVSSRRKDDGSSPLQKQLLDLSDTEEAHTFPEEQKGRVTEGETVRVMEEGKVIRDGLNGHHYSDLQSMHPDQQQIRRAVLKWGGIGLAATLATSGLFYWFTRTSLALPQRLLSPLMYTYYAPKGIGVFDVEWSPQGDFIACVNENNVVQVITVLPNGYRPSQTGFAVNCLTWSPDGTQLASPSLDKMIHIWDPLNRVDALHFPYFSSIPECIAWSHDGKCIVVCGTHGMVGTWDATTGRPLLTYAGHTGIVWWADWSPDNSRLATAGSDGLIHIWNATTGKILLTYTGHTQAVQDVKWSPSGKNIASASKDKTVHIWDAETGKTKLVYTKHIRSVQAAEWSPNEQFIASGSADTTIQIWDAETGKNFVSYRGHTNTVWTLAWSPDGQYLASSSGDGTMRVWRPFHFRN